MYGKLQCVKKLFHHLWKIRAQVILNRVIMLKLNLCSKTCNIWLSLELTKVLCLNLLSILSYYLLNHCHFYIENIDACNDNSWKMVFSDIALQRKRSSKANGLRWFQPFPTTSFSFLCLLSPRTFFSLFFLWSLQIHPEQRYISHVDKHVLERWSIVLVCFDFVQSKESQVVITIATICTNMHNIWMVGPAFGIVLQFHRKCNENFIHFRISLRRLVTAYDKMELEISWRATYYME